MEVEPEESEESVRSIWRCESSCCLLFPLFSCDSQAVVSRTSRPLRLVAFRRPTPPPPPPSLPFLQTPNTRALFLLFCYRSRARLYLFASDFLVARRSKAGYPGREPRPAGGTLTGERKEGPVAETEGEATREIDISVSTTRLIGGWNVGTHNVPRPRSAAMTERGRGDGPAVFDRHRHVVIVWTGSIRFDK